MPTTRDATVSDIAANSLSAVRVFERFGIDYCCGGKRPLADVCREKGLDPAAVESELTAAAKAPDADGRDWNTAPLRDLIDHVVTTHHEYLRRELAPLAERLEKVYRVYNERYGETLKGLPEVFARLRSELELHIQKEELILFPAIAALEGGGPVHACFATVAQPIRMIESEHYIAGSALADIREITSNYAIPEYACVTYRSLMSGLQELEQDLHVPIHLENNILFPRAIEYEARTR
jgi:regulator of cell morphogenesis and NO signaling